MPDETPQISASEALKKVHEKHEKLLRNRQSVAFCSAKIPIVEKLLAAAIENAKFYAESVIEQTKQLDALRKRYNFSIEYCEKHAEDYEHVKIADEIANKIKKLMAQLAEKNAEILRQYPEEAKKSE